MIMYKDWKELEEWLRTSGISAPTINRIVGKMNDIERRSLPERVANLLENFNEDKFVLNGGVPVGVLVSCEIRQIIIRTLRTGDTTELEKWLK